MRWQKGFGGSERTQSRVAILNEAAELLDDVIGSESVLAQGIGVLAPVRPRVDILLQETLRKGRVDLDKDLVIVQIRKTAGEKYGEYSEKFVVTIADSLL